MLRRGSRRGAGCSPSVPEKSPAIAERQAGNLPHVIIVDARVGQKAESPQSLLFAGIDNLIGLSETPIQYLAYGAGCVRITHFTVPAQSARPVIGIRSQDESCPSLVGWALPTAFLCK